MTLRRWLQILWPAFVGAGVMTLLVFAHVDPADVHTVAGKRFELPREGVYTLSFFGFWAVIAATAAISCWLQRPDAD
jgi:hypothetical protein